MVEEDERVRLASPGGSPVWNSWDGHTRQETDRPHRRASFPGAFQVHAHTDTYWLIWQAAIARFSTSTSFGYTLVMTSAVVIALP